LPEPWATRLRASCFLLALILLSGWRPHSRETSLAEVAAAEAADVPPPDGVGEACWAWPYSSADAVLLQRRTFIPAKPGLQTSRSNQTRWPAPRPSWTRAHADAAMCVQRASLEADALHEALSDDAPSWASTSERAVVPEWAGRERALGPILLSLVPLMWWIALDNSTLRVGTDLLVRSITRDNPDPFETSGGNITDDEVTWIVGRGRGAGRTVLLPPVLPIFAGSHACQDNGFSLSCFLRPEGARERIRN
jgi:hypothetical protein